MSDLKLIDEWTTHDKSQVNFLFFKYFLYSMLQSTVLMDQKLLLLVLSSMRIGHIK